MRLIVLFIAASALGCGGNSAPSVEPDRRAELATAKLSDSTGAQIGLATLGDSGGVLVLTVSVANLSSGAHGIHVHAQGTCTPPDFDSAGPHFNPEGRKHGLQSPDGAHAGDLPNIMIAANGSADTSLTIPSRLVRDALSSGSQTPLLSLVIHASPDDGVTDPSGNSGPRIACGVFRPA